MEMNFYNTQNNISCQDPINALLIILVSFYHMVRQTYDRLFLCIELARSSSIVCLAGRSLLVKLQPIFLKK